MPKISLCMIVKNEEDVLARCLDSIKEIVDEIIIVDTGSTDSTVEIARGYTDKIYNFQWIDDFSAARNFSFSKATKEYIMWLDADDVLLDGDRRALKELKNQLKSEVDIVMMKYNVAFDNQGNPSMTYYRERILSNSKNYQWLSPIHEVIIPSGTIIYSDIAITHKKEHPTDVDRNLKIFQGMIAKNIPFDPRQKFYYARELYYHDLYNQAIEEFTDFLEDGNGWIENNISACLDLANCYFSLNQPNNALHSLFRSFQFDVPRSESCCAIGDYFFRQLEYRTASFWYHTATIEKNPDIKGGFASPNCHKFIPFIQLCVCYDKLGDFKNAKKYHDKSKSIKPNHPSVLLNNKYFSEDIANIVDIAT